MKNFMTKQNGMGLMMLLVGVAMMVMPSPAFAAMATGVTQMLQTKEFATIISFGLGIFAAWKWFNYFANFNPNAAFSDIIVPAVITFLAFKWQDVLVWFGF